MAFKSLQELLQILLLVPKIYSLVIFLVEAVHLDSSVQMNSSKDISTIFVSRIEQSLQPLLAMLALYLLLVDLLSILPGMILHSLLTISVVMTISTILVGFLKQIRILIPPVLVPKLETPILM